MNDGIIPANKRLSVQRPVVGSSVDDRVQLRAPWYGPSRARANLYFITILLAPVVLLWIVAMLIALSLFQWTNALLGTLALAPYIVVLSSVLFVCLIPVSRRYDITIVDGCLTIQVSGWFINRSWTWPRDGVLAIGQVRGLWIVDAKGRREFFRERCDEELAWLASRLRRMLGVTNCPPPEPGELPVTIGVRFLNDEPGLLTLKPGELKIRHAFSPLRDMRIRPRKLPRLLWLLGFLPRTTVWVFPQDLVGSWTPDGGWCLQVLLGNDKPGLTLQSSDPEGLPRAIARFWGNLEDD